MMRVDGRARWAGDDRTVFVMSWCDLVCTALCDALLSERHTSASGGESESDGCGGA